MLNWNISSKIWIWIYGFIGFRDVHWRLLRTMQHKKYKIRPLFVIDRKVGENLTDSWEKFGRFWMYFTRAFSLTFISMKLFSKSSLMYSARLKALWVSFKRKIRNKKRKPKGEGQRNISAASKCNVQTAFITKPPFLISEIQKCSGGVNWKF